MAPLESAQFVREVRDKLYPNTGALNDRLKAFQITKHVAWYLRDLGYGLVRAKPGSENNADGYTCDVIAKSNGFHIDVLEDGEGEAKATWDPHDNEDEMKAIRPRWVMPHEVPDIFAEPDNGKEEPEEPTEEDKPLLDAPGLQELFKLLAMIVDNQSQNNKKLDEMISTLSTTNANLSKIANDIQARIKEGIPIRFGR